MVDLKISQFVDGGAVLTTDEIATNRGGVNTKVFVGSAASRDVGTGDDDIPTNADIPTSVANSLFGTSDTENTIGTGSKTFVTQAGKSFEVGRYLLIVDAANPDDNKMSGTVASYDSGTGDLVMEISTIVGSGTIDDWIIYVSGPTGQNGTDGDNGWSPVLAVVTDGARRVLQVVDWVGGEGTEPAIGLYIGATGLESDIANAVDIRGAQGPAGDGGTAADVDYDNTVSGLDAVNVQQAVDELATDIDGLGALATKDEIDVPTDINATGTPSATTALFGDGSWKSITSTTLPKIVVKFRGTGTAAILSQYGQITATLTDNGTGLYTLNLSSAFTSTNAMIVVTSGRRDATEVGWMHSTVTSTSTVQFRTTSSGGTVIDWAEVNVSIYGNLA